MTGFLTVWLLSSPTLPPETGTLTKITLLGIPLVIGLALVIISLLRVEMGGEIGTGFIGVVAFLLGAGYLATGHERSPLSAAMVSDTLGWALAHLAFGLLVFGVVCIAAGGIRSIVSTVFGALVILVGVIMILPTIGISVALPS